MTARGALRSIGTGRRACQILDRVRHLGTGERDRNYEIRLGMQEFAQIEEFIPAVILDAGIAGVIVVMSAEFSERRSHQVLERLSLFLVRSSQDAGVVHPQSSD